MGLLQELESIVAAAEAEIAKLRALFQHPAIQAADAAHAAAQAAATASAPAAQAPVIDYAAFDSLAALDMHLARSATDAEIAAWRAAHPSAPDPATHTASGDEIKPQTGDQLAAERACTLLDSFGKHKVLAKGAVAYKAPSMPAHALSTGQVPQLPGVAGPSSASIWYGATADTPKPEGLVAGLDCNNRIALPAPEGFICGESDNGGEFRVEIGSGE